MFTSAFCTENLKKSINFVLKRPSGLLRPGFSESRKGPWQQAVSVTIVPFCILLYIIPILSRLINREFVKTQQNPLQMRRFLRHLERVLLIPICFQETSDRNHTDQLHEEDSLPCMAAAFG